MLIKSSNWVRIIFGAALALVVVGVTSGAHVVPADSSWRGTLTVNKSLHLLLDCLPEDEDPEGDLTGQLIPSTYNVGNVLNTSLHCKYEVGLASYKKFDEVIDNQEIFDWTTSTIDALGTITLEVGLPNCAAQIDLFYGPVLFSLDGQRYGDRKLDWIHVGGTNYCEPDPGPLPIVFDSASSDEHSNPGNTLSFSHTVGDHDDRVLTVGTQAEDGSSDDCEAVHLFFNGDPLSRIDRAIVGTETFQCVSLWYLVAPDIGTHQVDVVWAGHVDNPSAGAISIYSADQHAPEAHNSKTLDDATTITTEVATLSNGAWVIDAVGSGNSGSGFDTLFDDEFERYETHAASSAGAGSTRHVVAAGDTVMSWHQDANRLAHVVAAFAPAEDLPVPPWVESPEDFSIFINFQPADAPTYPGYEIDSGVPFGYRGNGMTYGWNDSNYHARDRGSSLSTDQRYDTLNHLQKPSNPDGTWEIELPNGLYEVRLVAGDPSHIDSSYRMTLEDVAVLDGTPTSEVRWFDETVFVEVADGRLTLGNALGSSNNKIDFVDITYIGDSTP